MNFNKSWIDEINVNECSVAEYAREFVKNYNKSWRILEPLFLLKSITVLDLTTLNGDDTISNVIMLVNKAHTPIRTDIFNNVQSLVLELIEQIRSTNLSELVTKPGTTVQNNDTLLRYKYEDHVELKSLLESLGFKNEDILADMYAFLAISNDAVEFETKLDKNVRVAAICVFPKLVESVKYLQKERGSYVDETSTVENKTLGPKNTYALPIAAVAAGFPSGQYDLDSKTREIDFAIRSGANEIDIVISRSLVIAGSWQELFEEVRSLKQTCGNVKMKTILAVGECGSLENVYKASMVAMMAGSDYIKTSTGKETVNATIPVGVVMCRAVRNFYIKTGKKIGFKPAGGVRTSEDALLWLKLILTELGVEWLSYFRIGASGILANIEQRLKELSAKPSIKIK